jgi:hypothetical protein
MFKTALLATSAVAMASVGLPPSSSAQQEAKPEQIACDLHALTSEQRARHIAVSKKLLAGVKERRELDSGFALRVDEVLPFNDLGEWLDDERRCCPFLTLTLVAEPHKGAVWVQMTGPEGTKEFLRSVLE